MRLKKALARTFEVKDLGYLHYFLGIEVVFGVQGNLGSYTFSAVTARCCTCCLRVSHISKFLAMLSQSHLQ